MPAAGTEAKRRQVLQGAREVFLERGYDGASTDAIAGRAQVSKETVYRYYRSKQELLIAVMREMTVEQLVPAQAALPAPETPEELRSALVRLLERAQAVVGDPTYLALCRLVFGEGGRHPELGEMFRTAVPEAGGTALLRFLDDARSRGLLRADLDVAVAARMLIGPVLIWGLLGGLLGGDEPPPGALEEVVKTFMEGAA